MRDNDETYDDLMDELEAAIGESDTAARGERIRAIRVRIEDVLRAQLGLDVRVPPADRRHGPNALN